MTGAEMVVKALERNGIKIVFGYPGAANAPIIDRLSFSSIKHILTRNEQGAAHMASGYARVTKTVGVCTATSGPGATNLITGIATAFMDSVPMVALTGQVATNLIGRDAFQEVDIIGATLPFTKYSHLIQSGEEIPRVLDEAFYIASTGRPGPVLLDFPMDILKKTYDCPEEPEEINIRGYKLVGKPNESQVNKVAEAIKNSARPVILAGGGVVHSGATPQLRELVKLTGIPVVSTMMAIGTLPCDSPEYMGMLGSHGAKRANLTLTHADTVVILGSRLGDRTSAHAQGFKNNKTIIHVDIDPAEIGKNFVADIPVVGDVKDVLSSLVSLCADYRVYEDWADETRTLKEKYPPKYTTQDTGYVDPKYFLVRLSEKTGSDIYVTTEVGQNQIWVSNYFNFKDPDSLFTSGGFGTMGYGLPAAIGAATMAKKPVVAVMGDGSFQMDLPELATMCQWNIPVKMVVFKNDRLGMVHEHQYLLYGSNYQAVTIEGSPDFNKLAEAYGIENAYVAQNSEIDAGIDAMMNAKGSFLLVVSVDPFEATGDSLNENRLPKKEAK